MLSDIEVNSCLLLGYTVNFAKVPGMFFRTRVAGLTITAESTTWIVRNYVKDVAKRQVKVLHTFAKCLSIEGRIKMSAPVPLLNFRRLLCVTSRLRGSRGGWFGEGNNG